MKNSKKFFIACTILSCTALCAFGMLIACSGTQTSSLAENQTSNTVSDSSSVVDSLWQMGTSFEKPKQTLVIEIENLKPPTETLPEKPYNMVLGDILWNLEIEENQHVIANNRGQSQMVVFPHPFFDGMHRAFADHRPFVLSPDAVWLLICQGFSNHVNNNAKKLRHYFVDFEGKKKLTVSANDISLDNPNSPWEKYFPVFTSKIASYVGDSLVSYLTSDFSTSTLTTRTASQITVMASMKEYFDYEMVITCGIPKVILEGTPDDWQRIIDGVQFLRQYELDWWVDEMLPVLKKIKRASEGEVDKKFWRNMYKQREEKQDMGCGTQTNIIANGWVVKFYPYSGRKYRTNLQEIRKGSSSLPPEIVSVPLSFKDFTKGVEADLNLYAGFVGLSQDSETFALRPEVGWFITKPE